MRGVSPPSSPLPIQPDLCDVFCNSLLELPQSPPPVAQPMPQPSHQAILADLQMTVPGTTSSGPGCLPHQYSDGPQPFLLDPNPSVGQHLSEGLILMTYNVGGPSITPERYEKFLNSLMHLEAPPSFVGLCEFKMTGDLSQYQWLTAHVTRGRFYLCAPEEGGSCNGVAALISSDLTPHGPPK